ncbi:hypothetical protein KSD_07570 [Ktedonobacter sp. SOSP1-85]|uniref:tyrosine-type recombinase/integrase n=1 Tax=Ktedonobacter sp. SOSP1-85 TaxID=2778367 RepID=UPI0019160EC9|nr:tyrosine-type recombinase/integrase [Ktedonobacter sp. SOSP1-85]GHO72986.1 hypothetical protein KSD_07570 [Ktedonobacter sp. SOSP1-85]
MEMLPATLHNAEIIEVNGPQSIGELANLIAGKTAHTNYSATKAENTLRRQKADLKLFFQFLEVAHYEQPIHTFLVTGEWALWSGITHGLVEAFVHWQEQQGYSIGSINVRLATVKTYCTLAHKAGVIEQTAYASIRLVKGFSHKEGVHLNKKREVTRVGEKKESATSVSVAHAAMLKSQPDDKQGRRDRAMMCLLLDHGLRCGELTGLLVENIDLQAGTVTFYREKVDMVQTHNLTPDTLKALMAYLPDVQGPYLFGGYKGKAITTRAINKRVGELGKAIGLETLSPHDLRHYWATVAMRNGTDVKSLQVAGGWKSPYMPLRYAEATSIANQGVKLS